MGKKEKTAFIAIENNRIIAKGRSARELSRDFAQIEDKSHSWFCNRFRTLDTFTHLVDGRVFYFHKVTV